MKLFKSRKKEAGRPDFDRLPRHIAVIMDGNGRWAKKRGLPRTAGHAAGAEVFRKIATYCKDIGIQYFTVYAFSTENWKRPQEEVDAIMKLLEKFLGEALQDMEKNRVKVKFLGDITALSEDLQKLIAETEEISEKYEGVQVNLCVNYGGRDELVRGVNAWIKEHPGCEITEEELGNRLYTKGIPEPDLIIRPSGEYRLSNFLMWQSAYSEFYFTDVLWPDFTTRDMDEAIIAYQSRDRRYGGIK
ncbi:MAG: isoprenyl transferase [Oscillospiraceae bacterium]|nr:isoprenyl transferase [Oscillospiraceae bacterium]